MKLSIHAALELNNAINAAMQVGKFAPPMYGFVLAVNSKTLASVVEEYHKSRIALAKERASKNADGTPRLIMVEGSERFDIADVDNFNKELAEANKAEIDIELMMLPIDKFPSEVDPRLVASLLPIIEAA